MGYSEDQIGLKVIFTCLTLNRMWEEVVTSVEVGGEIQRLLTMFHLASMLTPSPRSGETGETFLPSFLDRISSPGWL